MNRWLVLACAACGAAALGHGCTDSDATQIVVLMDTDYGVPGEVDSIRARVTRGDDSGNAWTRVFELMPSAENNAEPVSLPASFGIIPGDAGLEPSINIEVAALERGTNRVLVERRVQTGFVEGQSRLVRLLLYQVCESQSCAPQQDCGCADGSACANPTCVDTWIAPDQLESIADPGSLPPETEFPMTEPIPTCDPPLTQCGDACVDLDSSVASCGACGNVCPAAWECTEGQCIDPTDCRRSGNACSGFSFCNEETGVCDRGCDRNEQCTGDNERCDIGTHECVCQRDFDRCRFDCVDTSSDPRFCGDCETICGSGEVCDTGTCVDPGDCRNPDVDCAGFTYCDPDTGGCVFGCDRDEQCIADNEVCDTAEHECACADGFHECGSVCSADDSVETCGESCVPCPEPDNGTATCDAIACGFACDEGYEPCADACCPEVDPCSCEANAIECGMAELCDVSIDCGSCDSSAPYCTEGACGCVDPFEPNGLPSLAYELSCAGGCDLRDLDETIVGTLDSASDLDFFEIDLEHEPNRDIELSVSGLESEPELYLTYICDDGDQEIIDCSGPSALILGLLYCIGTDGTPVVRLGQDCNDSKNARGRVILGVRARTGTYVGPCDLYSLEVRELDADD
ncbi:MAG: hypothetical protein AAF436_03620 [Myxococcota bacterium]